MPADSQVTVPSLVLKHLEIFACPACGGALRSSGDTLVCAAQQHEFPCRNGIPLLFWGNEWDRSKHDVTQAIRTFYEANPFPNYEQMDSAWSLREKAQHSVFARWLDEQLPHGARILEAGCGTGQLSNFLATRWGRTVFGTDLSVSSLTLGQRFKERNQIDDVAFLQMNLFRPAFKAETFDLVISNGVLHHTSDPFRGFQSIGQLVRPGGHIIIGLYNTLGRLPTHLRRVIFRLSGNRLTFLDPRLREKTVGKLRRQIWFMDQYKNPHESTHTIGEVLTWFDRTGFEFTNGIPKPKAFESLATDEQLFTPGSRGSWLDHALMQLGLLLTGGKEGGFFIMIGRKGAPAGPVAPASGTTR